MSKVYVTQATRHLNYNEAEKFGEVVFLTEQEIRPVPYPEAMNEHVVNDMMRNFKDYEPEVDYIMTTGSALPNVIVGSFLTRINRPHAVHKFLKWSNRSNSYEMFHLKF